MERAEQKGMREGRKVSERGKEGGKEDKRGESIEKGVKKEESE